MHIYNSLQMFVYLIRFFEVEIITFEVFHNSVCAPPSKELRSMKLGEGLLPPYGV